LSTCGDGTAFSSVSDRLIEIIKIEAAWNHPSSNNGMRVECKTPVL